MRGTVIVFSMSVGLVLWAGAARADSTRFSLVCDSRGAKGFADVAARMKEVPGGPGSFLVFVGDFRPAETTRRQLDEVFGKNFPWYPVIGNHETHRDDKKHRAPEMDYLRDFYRTHLKGKVNPGPKGTEETTYSFDAGDVHIAAINEYWGGRTEPDSDCRLHGDVVDALCEWLKADLAATRKPWKIVVGHEPAFPQEDRDWESERHATSSLNAQKGRRDRFWRVLERQGVAAYVCGHTHRYSRYRPEGSRVWQIDVGQARGSSSSWKYDTFVVATADSRTLRFEAYRNLKRRGDFDVTDELELKADDRTRESPQDTPSPPPAPGQ